MSIFKKRQRGLERSNSSWTDRDATNLKEKPGRLEARNTIKDTARLSRQHEEWPPGRKKGDPMKSKRRTDATHRGLRWEMRNKCTVCRKNTEGWSLVKSTSGRATLKTSHYQLWSHVERSTEKLVVKTADFEVATIGFDNCCDGHKLVEG